MTRDFTLSVFDNAKHLTVSLCYLHLERIDGLIAANGWRPRYIESREFFERQLQRCLKRRDARHYDYDRAKRPHELRREGLSR